MKARITNNLGDILIDENVIAKYAGTTAVECFGIVVMELDVFLTVKSAVRNRPPATRMLARCIRSAGHYYSLLNSFLT